MFATLWPISVATSSTDRSPCASRSTISARRPLDSALATDANASNSASFAAPEGTLAGYGRGRVFVKSSFEYVRSQRRAGSVAALEPNAVVDNFVGGHGGPDRPHLGECVGAETSSSSLDHVGDLRPFR